VAVAALVVLVAGAIGTYAWALAHWFVGVDGSGDNEQVAVFRGLEVSVVGFDLFEVDEDTGLALTDLTPAARNRVRGGITADDPDDADRILEALRDQRLPVCPTSSGATRAPASTAPRGPASRVPGGPTPGAATTFPGPDGLTTAAAPPGPAAGTTVAPPTTAPLTSALPTSDPTTSARTTASSEPGVTCREED
jgi:protein phosphatase